MSQWLLIPLGFAVGAYGTLIGAGGGFVLVPLLLLLYPHESPATVSSVSLAVVFFNALSGSYACARQGRIDYRTGVIFAAATAPGALLGALVVGFLSRGFFDTLFGALLIVVAAFVVFRSGVRTVHVVPPRPGMTTRTVTDAHGDTYVYRFVQWHGILLSIGVGFLSSLLGIGGGIIHVPVLVEFLNFPLHIATATSQFILTFMALIGTVGHLAAGQFGSHVGGDRVLLLTLEMGHKVWAFAINDLGIVGDQVLFLTIGVVPGAQLGARFSYRLRGALIFRALGVALLIVGVRLLLTPFLG